MLKKETAIKNHLVKKACKSACIFKISAIAFDKKGDILGSSVNSKFRLSKGCGIHAEMALMTQYSGRIKTIIICRVGNSGNILPIDPCDNCKKTADRLGIKIISISTDEQEND